MDPELRPGSNDVSDGLQDFQGSARPDETGAALSYFPMQEEKDNRVYGALDAALRGDMFRNVEPRWIEWMKLFLAIIPFPEISAARSMAMVARLAPGEELRTGMTMQMVDEFRHSTIQMNLKKWYMENYIDPAGFDITEAAFGQVLRHHHRASVRRGFSDWRRDHRRERLSDGRRRDRVHQHAVRRDAPRRRRATATTLCRRCSCRCSRTNRATSATATRC